MYSEETDLCAPTPRAGWGIEYFPAVTVMHHRPWSRAGVPERRINESGAGGTAIGRSTTRAGARVAALLTGAQYAVRGLIRARDHDFAARMRLHAHDAIRVTGPGPARARRGWNRAHDA